MKMFRVLLVPALCGILFSSCKKHEEAHLPAKKMEDILLDVSIAETYSIMNQSNINFGGAKSTDSLALFYTKIFAKHHVTKEQFEETMAWYKNHQNDLDTLYTNVSAKADQLLEKEIKKKNQNGGGL